MTLHKDPTWLDTKSWSYEWCLDCDTCGNHIHIPPSRQQDARMSDRIKGWTLDIEGKDYCPECKPVSQGDKKASKTFE